MQIYAQYAGPMPDIWSFEVTTILALWNFHAILVLRCFYLSELRAGTELTDRRTGKSNIAAYYNRRTKPMRKNPKNIRITTLFSGLL